LRRGIPGRRVTTWRATMKVCIGDVHMRADNVRNEVASKRIAGDRFAQIPASAAFRRVIFRLGDKKLFTCCFWVLAR
jgi:hypothetical protein